MSEISVIVPCYNVEGYLPLCLDSLRNQTFPDIEILCVNDGSTDRTGEILALAESVDPRVRVITKPNGGLSSARNAGLDHAQGRIIMFVDSDDYLKLNACAKVKAAFDAHDPEIVTFGASVLPGAASYPWLDRVLSPQPKVYEQYEDSLLFNEASCPFVWRTAVSKSLVERTGIRFDEGVAFGEDQIFHFEAYPASRKTVLLADKLYVYRVGRVNSLMVTRGDNVVLKLKEHQAIVRHILVAWREHGWMARPIQAIADWVVEFLIFDLSWQSASTRARLAPGVRAIVNEFFSDESGLSTIDPSTRAILDVARDPMYKGLLKPLMVWKQQCHKNGLTKTGTAALRRVLASGALGMGKRVLRHVLPAPASHLGNYVEAITELNADSTQRTMALQLLDLEARQKVQA